MRRVYQREWFGIPFLSFTRGSSRELADAAFYQAFYRAFFQRYRSWEDLDPDWRNQKRAIAQFILEGVKPGQRLLSIGCGLGWIEHCLLEFSNARLHLELTELTDSSLKWIKDEILADRLHLGIFPQCIPAGRKYDLIYLSALDYCLDQAALVELLRAIRGMLANRGQCLLISASFAHPRPLWREALSRAKSEVKALLENLGLHHRGQFWGWSRTQGDYHGALTRAGFAGLKDGFVPAPQGTAGYWIEGRLP